jgi:hypothetical protein
MPEGYGLMQTKSKQVKRLKTYIRNLFGTYNIVYRPLTVNDNGCEALDVCIFDKTDKTKLVWMDIISGEVLDHKGVDDVELLKMVDLVGKTKDLIYAEAEETIESEAKVWEIADKAKLIVAGVAFIQREDGKYDVRDLDHLNHTALLSPGLRILEADMPYARRVNLKRILNKNYKYL